MSSIGNKEVLAKNLNYYIERSGKTKKEIAEIVGVAASTLNDWTKAKKYPRIDRIEILANYFGIVKSDLIEDKKEKPTFDDGLTENKRILIDFAKSLPDDKAALALRLLKSLAEADE